MSSAVRKYGLVGSPHSASSPYVSLCESTGGLLQAPMTKFAQLLNAVPAKFAYGLQALIDQGGAPGAPTAAAAPAEEAPADEAPAETETEITEPETSETQES